MAKRRPSILQGLRLDGKVVEASPPDAPTPVKPRPAKPESRGAGGTLPLLFAFPARCRAAEFLGG